MRLDSHLIPEGFLTQLQELDFTYPEWTHAESPLGWCLGVKLIETDYREPGWMLQVSVCQEKSYFNHAIYIWNTEWREKLLNHLRTLHYPVDKILRLKRLNALLS